MEVIEINHLLVLSVSIEMCEILNIPILRLNQANEIIWRFDSTGEYNVRSGDKVCV